MNDAERTALQTTFATLSGAAMAATAVLAGPMAIVARVISTAFGVASALLSQGATPQQVIDAIKRVRHIDTRADDAAVDAKNAAKPSRDVGIPARDAGIPANLLCELGIADTVPAPSATVPEMQRRLASLKREASGNTDAERVEYLQAEIDVIEREIRRRGARGEPGEGD